MDGHASWFSLLIPHWDEYLARFRETIGLSFIENTHETVAMQYLVGFLFISILIIVLVSIARTRITNVDKALIPEGKLTIANFFESMIEGSIETMAGAMDRKDALFFFPLIGTCAFIIFFSNLIGLVPGFIPPTSNLNMTAMMAIIVFSVTHIYGVKEHGLGYFAHWFGPIRKWYALPLMILMFCIEVVSHIARPVSLAIRLMGNMYADHKVVGVFTILIPILVPLPMLILGVLVCLVQTAVFCILSTVYIGMAIAHEEH